MFYFLILIAREYLLKIYYSLKVFYSGKNDVPKDPELEMSRNLNSGQFKIKIKTS